MWGPPQSALSHQFADTGGGYGFRLESAQATTGLLDRVTSPYATPEVELQDMRSHLHCHEALLIAAQDAHTVLDIILNAADPDAAHSAS